MMNDVHYVHIALHTPFKDQSVSWKELAFFDGFCLGNFLPKSGSTDLGGVELAFVYAFRCLTQNAVKCFDFKRFTSCCKNQNI